MTKEQLKTFNSIRVVAQHINNEIFQKEYKNIMLPLLNKFKTYKNESDNSIVIQDELNYFIKAMHQKAITFQYVPYQRNKRLNNDDVFKEHNKLLELELLCQDLIVERRIAT